MVEGRMEYHGLLSVTIRYNKESNKWIALSEKSTDFVASSEVSGPSLLLGPQVGKYLKSRKYFDLFSSDKNQTWLVSNDSASCSGQAASYTARLSLSACQGGRRSKPISLQPWLILLLN